MSASEHVEVNGLLQGVTDALDYLERHPGDEYAMRRLRERIAALSAEPVGDVSIDDDLTRFVENLASEHGESNEGGREDGWYFCSENFHAFCRELLRAGRLAQPQRQGEAGMGSFKKGDPDFNGCHEQAARALRYLAKHDRPDGGEQFPNTECCLMIANDLDRSMAAIREHYKQQPASQGQAPDARVATDNGHKVGLLLRDLEVGTPLYAAQPASQWQAAAVETIKRVAAQLCEDEMTGDAADLLDAMFALTQPASVAVAGWKLVPVDPTDEMIRAALYPDGSRAPMLAREWSRIKRDYQHMLAAAPEVKEGGARA